MNQENKPRYPGCDDPREVSDFLMSQKGEIFVDIGASDGFYTIHLAPNFKRIFSYEPYPSTAAYLRKIVTSRHLGAVKVIEKAVSDKVEVKDFYISPRGIRCHSLKPVGLGKISVEGTTLAKEFPGKIIDLIKVDVEGAEFEVLRGAIPIIENIKAWVIEVHDLTEICGAYAQTKRTLASRCRDMKRYLKTLGYQTKWISKKKTIYAWRE